MKFLDPRTHGYLDYAAVAVLALAPTLFGFGGVAATICYVVAAMQLGMSLLTAYPLGVAKVIPFSVHGAIELVVAMALVVAPWLLGFSSEDAARNFFVVAGLGLFSVYLVTNYKAAGRSRHHGFRAHRVASRA